MLESPEFVEEYSGIPIQIYKSAFFEPEKIQTTRKLNFINSLKHFFVSVFLPQGYPHTVAEDYAEYQIWDTVQAFASSLNGALSTAAILKGAGVGDQEATVLAASLTWMLKDGTGMIGRIIFAWKKGTQLDSNCKKWRLVADVLNDLAFGLDLLAPHFPKSFFAPISCGSSSLRAIVGVAGGATRTAVTRHQAKRENLADVAAKDGSQETLVNFISLLVSLFMLPAVDQNASLVWLLSISFMIVHIYANYRAVRSLKFDSLNQKRFSYCVEKCAKEKNVPSILDANKAEPLFWNLGSKKFLGCTLKNAKKVDSQIQTTTLEPKHGKWMACFVPTKKKSFVALRTDATIDDQFDGTFAVEFMNFVGKWPSTEDFKEFKKKLIEKGWDLSKSQLDFDEWRFRQKNE